jgi:hypothetical protein
MKKRGPTSVILSKTGADTNDISRQISPILSHVSEHEFNQCGFSGARVHPQRRSPQIPLDSTSRTQLFIQHFHTNWPRRRFAIILVSRTGQVQLPQWSLTQWLNNTMSRTRSYHCHHTTQQC